MRTSVIVVGGCVVVLGGAYFASRVLVSDVPQPVVQTVVLPAEAMAPPIAAPPPPVAARPGVNRGEAEAAMLAPRNGPLQQVNAAPVYPRLATANADPEVAESPFQGNSKELDYVETLLAEPDADLERVRSAHEVLTRCLEQEPANQRCAAAMELAKTRLGARDASQRKAQLPTLRVEPPNVVKPAQGPR
ncbi:MAG: hypothetical protein Q8L48_26540 [Archangium sp.]|nr:hypothetical protein [Archangium sp.]